MSSDFLNYISGFLDRIGIPSEAKNEIMRVEKIIFSNENICKVFLNSKEKLMNRNSSFDEALSAIGPFSEKLGISLYTLQFVFIINCTDRLLIEYKEENIEEQIFWDTMDDFRCKIMECREVMGVWGTFVAGWYADFLNMKRFALGRFQYEEAAFKGDMYEKAGIVVKKGDRVYNFHIPSSGKPFDKQARIASYLKAYDFFGYAEKGGNIIFICDSWLLYKEHEKILPKSSNILDFMQDFDIVSSEENGNYEDSWRIFGKYHKLPFEQLPIDTSLRKAVAEHLQAGGKMGSGFGIIVFDGHKILNNG